MKIYLLEDEHNIYLYIKSLLDEIPYVQVVGHSPTIAEAERELIVAKPDLILADIQLKDGSSLSLLSKLELDVSIIFITAFNQYAIEALNIGAIGYLLKPLVANTFMETIEKCYRKNTEFRFNSMQLNMAENYLKSPAKPKRIALRTFEYTQILNVEDILYCHGDKGYTTFYTKDTNPMMVSKVLKHFEAMLPDSDFIRCHQSYLINVNYIKKYYKDGQLEMTDGKLIPVSSRKKEVILQFLNEFN
ncbi:LytTR family DNA-binding domain-containing protein [Sphingobacterium sp. SRCM116780]|uniref:LytR/AlgR family response regulator transcription factor n=1 Tax=Sphingobacterium sp. SRCM116780 TaxID=2907623 RepID=UPI001F478A7E|nr:LytTR family DNA-binding domain-containing protein [Sphingobacterium sp. SRCM116780]UIR57289.1 LytTR family DNA-binding domain-containing protein [Sphingobacterium sp. SRCM116780]